MKFAKRLSRCRTWDTSVWRWKPAKIRNLVEGKDRNGKPRWDGTVKGRELVVVADGVKEPVKLRYLHSGPWFGALYSDACLPLGAFAIRK